MSFANLKPLFAADSLPVDTDSLSIPGAMCFRVGEANCRMRNIVSVDFVNVN